MEYRSKSLTSSHNSSVVSGKSKLLRNAQAHAVEEAKHRVKEKEAHPERRLLFRPKVYDSWRDEDIDDEIEEREQLIREIEKREQEIKKKKEEGDIDSDDEDDEGLEAQKARLERLKGRKKREEIYKARIEAETLREEQEKALAYEERCISELQNPSVYGWFYTDGYYDNNLYFGVKESYIDKMLEEQEQWKEKWLVKHPESFTDKFKKHFWPPKLLLKKRMFRTRGTYMDFPEVIADWPKDLDVTFEHGEHELISNAHALFQENLDDEALIAITEGEDEDEGEEIVLRQAPKDDKSKLKVDVHQGDYEWYDWYYDDEVGEFFRKKEGFMIEYYMDEKNNCWRHKRAQKRPPNRQPTPYDWYFDFATGTFLAREDYKGLDEFVYDAKTGVYRLQPIIPTATKVKKNSNNSTSRPARQSTTAKQQKQAEKEMERNRNLVHTYYFDEEEGVWLLKSEAPEDRKDDILWDDNGQRYARKVEGDWRGLTGLSPDDYYFNDKTGRFTPKPPRQGKDYKYYGSDGVWRRATAPAPETLTRIMGNTPDDYYFDGFEGQFKLKILPTAGKYWLQTYAHIWRCHPPPKSGMYPEEFYWDTSKKQWLPRVIRMEMLHNAQTAKNQWTAEITRGARGKISLSEGFSPNAYYWDIEEGHFILKSKQAKYYLDKDGFWKSVKLRDKQRNRIFEYDFFYNYKTQEFTRKQKGEKYVFNNKRNVWTTSDAPEDFECDYAFDVEQETWTPKASAMGYVDLGICIKPHSNSNVKIPSDFWFHETEGRFYPKVPEDASEYFYNSSEGVWKKRGITGTISVSGLNPRNFYYDDHSNRFKLQIDGQKKDYWFDNNNKIFRHVHSTGATRSGHQPEDFHWNSDLKAFVLAKPQDKLRGNIVDDVPVWDPMRRYDKGWLPSQDVSTVSTSVQGSVKRKTNQK